MPRVGWCQRTSASQPTIRSVVEIDLRLVVHVELAALPGLAQVEFQRPAGLGAGIHVDLEEAIGAATLALGPIEGEVGALEQAVGLGPVAGRERDADRGADVDLVAVDVEGRDQRLHDAAGEADGVVDLADGRLQHDELVAAEPCDDIALAHRALQPLGDTLEKPVADRVAERIIDRFEAVEVDPQHGRLGRADANTAQRLVHAGMEGGAIGKPGQLVEAGHARDGMLGLLAGRDVFEDHHRAAGRHRALRQRDGAPVGERRLGLARAPLQQLPRQGRDDAPRRGAGMLAVQDAEADQVLHAGAGPDTRLGQARDLEKALVPHRQAVVAVEHAQAVRHVGERRIEALGLLLVAVGELGLLLGRHQRLDDDLADRQGDVDHRVDEEKEDQAEADIDPAAMDDERQGERQHREGELADGDIGAAGIAPGDAGGIASRHGGDDEMHRRVVREQDGEHALQAEQPRIGPGAGGVDALPAQRLAQSAADAAATIDEGGDDAGEAAQEDRDAAQRQPDDVGAKRDDGADDAARNRSRHERGHWAVQGLDERRAHVDRQRRIRLSDSKELAEHGH